MRFTLNLGIPNDLTDKVPQPPLKIVLNGIFVVCRALQVYEQKGVPMSALLQAQPQEEGARTLRGRLRYPHNVIIWTKCDQDGEYPPVFPRRHPVNTPGVP